MLTTIFFVCKLTLFIRLISFYTSSKIDSCPHMMAKVLRLSLGKNTRDSNFCKYGIKLKMLDRGREAAFAAIFISITLAFLIISGATVAEISGIFLRPAIAQSQTQNVYETDSLFIALLATGNALIEYDLKILQRGPETKVTLYGQTIDDLIVVDYSDNLVEYTLGDKPGEIILDTTSNSNVRITYQTPDLVSKESRFWTFKINSSSTFSVKMPPDSLVTDWPVPYPSVRQIGSQQLLTFDRPGAIEFVYIIGFLGTEDQANISIKVAEGTIRDAKAAHPDIVLTEQENLLKQAKDAKAAAKFTDADRLATQTTDMTTNAVRDYVAAQAAISDAAAKIEAAAAEGKDVGPASSLLSQAKSQFSSGQYPTARSSAEQVTPTLAQSKPFPQAENPLSNYAAIAGVIGAAAAAAGAVVFMVLKGKKEKRLAVAKGSALSVSRKTPPGAKQGNGAVEGAVGNVASNYSPDLDKPATEYTETDISHLDANDNALPEVKGLPGQQQEVGERDEVRPVGLPTADFSPRVAQDSSAIPESRTDQTILLKIVARILSDRPHLRPEDQDVLHFLAEKEGAAFESELRGKFQLPKTTIWRLVKRLEREELVEIRKAGGQNLIKLRFENRPY